MTTTEDRAKDMGTNIEGRTIKQPSGVGPSTIESATVSKNLFGPLATNARKIAPNPGHPPVKSVLTFVCEVSSKKIRPPQTIPNEYIRMNMAGVRHRLATFTSQNKKSKCAHVENS
jgi:hypothetical protein